MSHDLNDVSPYLLSLPCATIEKVRSDLSDIVKLSEKKLSLQLDGAHIIYGMMSFYHSFEVYQRLSDVIVDYFRVRIKTCSPCACAYWLRPSFWAPA